MDKSSLNEEVATLSSRVQTMHTGDVVSELEGQCKCGKNIDLTQSNTTTTRSRSTSNNNNIDNNNIVKHGHGEILYRPQYHVVDLKEHMGTNVFSLTDFDEINSLEVKSDDILVVSFPRSGKIFDRFI